MSMVCGMPWIFPSKVKTLDDGLVEVITHRGDHFGQVLQLPGTDHVEGTALLHLEYIGNVVGEQLGGENVSVVAGIPLHVDFRGGEFGGVAFDCLLHPFLPVLVVPLDQGRAATRRLFATEPGVGAAGAEGGRRGEAVKS